MTLFLLKLWLALKMADTKNSRMSYGVEALKVNKTITGTKINLRTVSKLPTEQKKIKKPNKKDKINRKGGNLDTKETMCAVVGGLDF